MTAGASDDGLRRQPGTTGWLRHSVLLDYVSPATSGATRRGRHRSRWSRLATAELSWDGRRQIGERLGELPMAQLNTQLGRQLDEGQAVRQLLQLVDWARSVAMAATSDDESISAVEAGLATVGEPCTGDPGAEWADVRSLALW